MLSAMGLPTPRELARAIVNALLTPIWLLVYAWLFVASLFIRRPDDED
jgi:hypothetical protein